MSKFNSAENYKYPYISIWRILALRFNLDGSLLNVSKSQATKEMRQPLDRKTIPLKKKK